MHTIRITKEFNFEMAHALKGYNGPCKNLHGHSYRLFVTVKGTPINETNHPKQGMVIDFGDLKNIVHQSIINHLDHALLIHKDTSKELLSAIEGKDMFEKIILADYQPTSENMLIDFAKKIKAQLPQNVELFSLKLHETATSFSEWYADDNR